MLSHAFIEWWFNPWACAGSAPEWPLPAADTLGRRDAYRLWCAQALVVADLPPRFALPWHILAGLSGTELAATARLFAGLVAARDHQQAVLGELAVRDRKWCISIAATQPLRRAQDVPYTAQDGIEVRGLVELARRLEVAFPGLWSRLRLTLGPALAARVDALAPAAMASAAEDAAGVAASTRAARCWTLCHAHACPEDRRAAVDDWSAADPERAGHVADRTMPV
jgi:hypothetical protein